MDRLDPPVALGLLASILTVLAVLLPYAMPSLGASAVSTYYDFGVLGGWSVLVVATVAVVVFAAAAADRTDQATAAGAGLTLGVAALALAGYWIATLPYDVVVQLSTDDWFAHHRWLLLAASAGIALGGVWSATEQHLL